MTQPPGSPARVRIGAPPGLPPRIGRVARGLGRALQVFGLAGEALAPFVPDSAFDGPVTTDQPVQGHPDLAGQVARAPGERSGTVKINQAGGAGSVLAVLAMDPEGVLRETAGSGAVLGHADLGAGTVTLTPPGEALVRRKAEQAGVTLAPPAQAAPAPDKPAQADAGGNTGRLPPDPPENVRLDGECDEDENMGPTLPTPRLPRPQTGRWENADGTQGQPGESVWFSNNPDVQAVTGGRGIQFARGRPDFTPWARLSINLPHGEFNGSKKDFAKVYDAMSRADPTTFPTSADAKRYVTEQGLTPHHALDTCIQLVPEDLNNALPHIGSAADMRADRPAPQQTLLTPRGLGTQP